MYVDRGRREVLHGLSFEIGSGMLTGLLGSSAGGQSTLLHSIAGVQAGVRGSLDVLARPAGAPAIRSLIGYVTQSPSVYAGLTVERSLRCCAAIVGGGDERVQQVIGAVDLTAAASQRVETLSGGQRARVSLAA